MVDDNIHDYTVKMFIPLKYNDENIKVESDDPHIINCIKKIVDNVRKVVKQMCPNVQKLIGIFIKLPFNTDNPIILGCRIYNTTLMEYYYEYHHYVDFDKKISPLNMVPRTVYGKLKYYHYLPIQLLDHILNFDNILDAIYYKVLSDGNIHIFRINLNFENHPSIDYITTDVSLCNKLKKNCYSKLNDVQIVEEFMKIVGYIFRSPGKSARN